MKLLWIGAFFKADQKDGLSLRFCEKSSEDLSGALNLLRLAWDEQWRDAVYKNQTARVGQQLMRELDELRAKPQERRTPEEIWTAVANIDLLERVGQLKSDEYNGIGLMLQGEDGTPVYLLRALKP